MFEKYDTEILNSFQTPGYAHNGVPRDPNYEIPDVVFKTPTIRKIKVISLGAGVSGIANAYFIQKHLQNVDHVIYEKNADLGGTWLENRYPSMFSTILHSG
jgi:hydroxyversicolorone monooxygenase